MVYEEYKVYGPYTRKDGRQHVILVKDGVKKTVSYPKYLMECHLDRYLEPDETVDHIDKDFNNNSFSNLRVLSLKDHVKDDVIRIKDAVVKCAYCGKEFTIPGHNIRYYNRRGTGYFCSRECSGKHGKEIQLHLKTPVMVEKIERVYYCNKGI